MGGVVRIGKYIKVAPPSALRFRSDARPSDTVGIPVNESITIDGFGPLPLRSPADAADLGLLVRESAAVYPVGGGTHAHVGFPPNKPGIAVSLRKLNRVIDHAARDMTITVQAGLTFAELASVLAKENQWLPVDVPNTERATIGGALAVNASGPRRLGQGTLRDSVLGVSFVNDEGVEVKAGGRVVKNVAGYDLMKLQIGALGTLGILTQVTLKVKPRPEASALVAFGLNAATVAPTLERLHASVSRPIAVELLNANAAKAAGLDCGEAWVIACGFEEKRETVDWQVETLLGELKSSPVREVRGIRGADAELVWKALTQLIAGDESHLGLKANVLPSRCAAMALAMAGNAEAIVHAHAGSGIVQGHFPAETLEKASRTTHEILKSAAEGNANLTVQRCPSEWKPRLPLWGRETADRKIMRTILRTLDPQGKFNPGRLFCY
jgi:glycolate oxidase FAD binding subunit